MLSRTPIKITEQIIKFCNEIDKSQKPCWVSVKPDPESEIKECFPNVKTKVEKDGGRIQFGRAIWEWPNILLEAEFHAVWVSPANEHIDITPSEMGGAQRILFLPDSKLEYDFVSDSKRIPHEFQALKDDPLVHRLIEVTKLLFDIEETHSTGLEVILEGPVLEHFEKLLREQTSIQQQLMSQSQPQPERGRPGRNSPCPCGSGKKFKKCCGK
jgi:hypothetical protein